MKKLISILLILATGIGLYVWFFVYNKAHTNYQQATAVFVGQADELLAKTSQSNFLETYLNQAVEVSGSVTEQGSTGFTLGSGLICTLDSSQVRALPNLGDVVTIKGRLVGVDEDILTGETICNLDQCVLLE